MQNNYTYNIPYSKYFDMENYTLKFGVSEHKTVHMCHHGVSRSCDLNSDAEENWPQVAVEWKIPIGQYKSSFFRFRVTNENNNNVCTQRGEESMGMFVEYNLFFARQC